MRTAIIVIILALVLSAGFGFWLAKENSANTSQASVAKSDSCGDGICQSICDLGPTVGNKACVLEEPKTCPADCHLACNWTTDYVISIEENAGTDQADEVNNKCDAGKYDRSGKRLGSYSATIAVRDYACTSDTDCPTGHYCNQVQFKADPQKPDGPTAGKICITNPQTTTGE